MGFSDRGPDPELSQTITTVNSHPIKRTAMDMLLDTQNSAFLSWGTNRANTLVSFFRFSQLLSIFWEWTDQNHSMFWWTEKGCHWTLFQFYILMLWWDLSVVSPSSHWNAIRTKKYLPSPMWLLLLSCSQFGISTKIQPTWMLIVSNDPVQVRSLYTELAVRKVTQLTVEERKPGF